MRRWLLALALVGMLVSSGCSLCAAIEGDDCDDCCHDCCHDCCDCGYDCCD